jgi:hypothetical protein
MRTPAVLAPKNIVVVLNSKTTIQLTMCHRHDHRDHRRHDRISDYDRHPRYEHARPEEGYRPWGGGEMYTCHSSRRGCMPEKPEAVPDLHSTL